MLDEAFDEHAELEEIIKIETPRILDLTNADPDKSTTAVSSAKLKIQRLNLAIPLLRQRVDAIERGAKLSSGMRSPGGGGIEIMHRNKDVILGEDGYTNCCDNAPRNIFSLTGFVLKILKSVAPSPTRAIKHFQDDRNRAIRLFSGFY